MSSSVFLGRKLSLPWLDVGRDGRSREIPEKQTPVEDQDFRPHSWPAWEEEGEGRPPVSLDLLSDGAGQAQQPQGRSIVAREFARKMGIWEI